ncbi:MAG: hypothetical protein MRJ96_09320 [Nitrospirales bacterium]|nr:cytochrome c [Nitrospira sp.]MDR4501633.1 hypothetical protein [Nitrospirales bacterium]
MGLTKLAGRVFIWCMLTFGCSHQPGTPDRTHMNGKNPEVLTSAPDDHQGFTLSPSAETAHRAVMREHLEAVHDIVSALAQENFPKAEHVAMTQLGFAKHREAMRRQQPENFPPAYHDLAMAHHQAAEELARAMSSHDLQKILPHLERTLRACVVCHQTYQR